MPAVKADSSGRRNTSVVEVLDGPVEEAGAWGSGWGAAAVGGGSGFTAADAVTGSAGAVACGAAGVLAVDRFGDHDGRGGGGGRRVTAGGGALVPACWWHAAVEPG